LGDPSNRITSADTSVLYDGSAGAINIVNDNVLYHSLF
jgi:hypothetical protein